MKELENKAEYLPLSALKKLENNPRTIKKADFEKLKDSIKSNPDYFEARPIICSDRTGKNVILGGNQRYEAAKALGLEEVPVIVLHGLDEAREREIVIRDNVNNGDWDFDILANEWDAEELEDWGVEADWPSDEKDVVEDEAPEVNESKPAESQLGGVYQLGEHRLMCGDSADAESVAILMDGQKADMVFTDPPYGNGESGKYGRGQLGVRTILGDESLAAFNGFMDIIPADKIIYFLQWRTLAESIKTTEDKGLKINTVAVWDKKNAGLNGAGGISEQWEAIVFAGNIKYRKFGGNVFSISREQHKREDSPHPHQKPIKLLAELFDFVDGCNTILDPFGGSGSTLIACEQLDRKCYMMELDPHYCDVIRKRWWKFKTGSEEGWQEGTK